MWRWPRRPSGETVDSLLNRELSTLEFNARVLELVGRRDAAAARAREDLPILLLEPGRVLHGARRRADGAGGVRGRGSLGRRAHAAGGAGADPRARPRADRAAVEALEEVALAPRSRRRGSRSSAMGDLDAEELRVARGPLPARDLPGADAARRRARAAVPVHLRAFRSASGCSRATRRRGEERFARVKVPGGAAALLPGRLERPAAAARERDRPLPRPALPRHGDRGARRCSASPATPTSRSRTRPTTCSRRSSTSSAAAASATSCGSRSPSSTSSGMLERLQQRARRRRRAGLRGARHARPRRPRPARRARPPRVEVRALARRDPARLAARQASRATSSPRSAAATSSSTSRTSRSRRASRRSSRPPRADPDVIAMKTAVYRTSGDSPLVACADPVRRGRASRASASSS